MFGPLGVPELIFILVLALLIFGPKRLPEIGRTLGRAMGEFRRATSDLKQSIESEINLSEDNRPTSPVQQSKSAPQVEQSEPPATAQQGEPAPAAPQSQQE